MAGIFDGITGLLVGVFGGSVTWTPTGGSATEIDAVFREEPVRVPDEDGGEILIEFPTLRVQKPVANGLARGDLIAPGNGKTYTIGAPHGTGSPAADAFVVFELEVQE